MIYDVCVIGGGIVGLATAFRILEKNPSLKLCLLEKEAEIAVHQTGSNSGVIHSGIYYRPGSYKANNCLRGYNDLINFCNEHDIPYNLCGKLIVAIDKKEIPVLDNLYQRGIDNGLDRIKMLRKEEISEFEPYTNGLAAIHLPYTGIIDFKSVAWKLAEIIRNKYNAELFTSTKVKAVDLKGKYPIILAGERSFETKFIINTAGLHSDRVARMTVRDPGVRIIPFRGEYYTIKPEKEYLVRSLVYPVPDPRFPFLGVHFTRMINGGVEAGPNAVLAFKREGYKKTDFSMKDTWSSLSWPGFIKVMFRYAAMGTGEYYRSFYKPAFTKALQKLIPEIREHDLIKGGAGVRAQACDRKGNLHDDFLFAENKYAINVLNAPSPAATASLSIGKFIAEKFTQRIIS